LPCCITVFRLKQTDVGCSLSPPPRICLFLRFPKLPPSLPPPHFFPFQALSLSGKLFQPNCFFLKKPPNAPSPLPSSLPAAFFLLNFESPFRLKSVGNAFVPPPHLPYYRNLHKGVQGTLAPLLLVKPPFQRPRKETGAPPEAPLTRSPRTPMFLHNHIMPISHLRPHQVAPLFWVMRRIIKQPLTCASSFADSILNNSLITSWRTLGHLIDRAQNPFFPPFFSTCLDV